MGTIHTLPVRDNGYLINTRSLAYRRITQAGFSIKNLFVEHLDSDKMSFAANFTCVCGKEEYIRSSFSKSAFNMYVLGNSVDVAAFIEIAGAVSANHLRQDGYTEDQIKEIRKAYEKEVA